MVGKRIVREKLTIYKMIKHYERYNPDAVSVPGYYDALYQYALKRLDKCVYGEEKPACKKCPIHCYPFAKREEVKKIMRWSGPRMLWHHPILALYHLIDNKRPLPLLPEKYQRKKSTQ